MRATLRNGAKVLNYMALDTGAIVLCEWGNEFVAWTVDDDGNAYLGVYCSTYREAMKAFLHKAALYKLCA